MAKEIKFVIDDIFKNLPGRGVVWVWNNGVQQRIQLTLSENMKCPMCGSSRGYTCLHDPKQSATEWQWGCLENNCIKINTRGAKKIMDKIRKEEEERKERLAMSGAR